MTLFVASVAECCCSWGSLSYSMWFIATPRACCCSGFKAGTCSSASSPTSSTECCCSWGSLSYSMWFIATPRACCCSGFKAGTCSSASSPTSSTEPWSLAHPWVPVTLPLTLPTLLMINLSYQIPILVLVPERQPFA